MRLREKLKLAFLFHKITSDPLMMAKLKSRKFWALIGGGVIVLAGENLGISTEATHWFAGLVASYILGQGAVDTVAANAAGK